jgi:TolB-like protein/DNA-binding winged helix-turn-helix (wHTH) protein/Tfp pilus assembly protein PilF
MQSVKFDSFELRPIERALFREGAACNVGSRALDVLIALVERRDRVVTKNELLDIAWPGLVVEENNLSVQISGLRKLIGTNAIATVAGRGYQFVTSVEVAKSVADAPTGSVGARIVRSLVAIVSAEVANWLAIVRGDCEAGIEAWKALRATVVEAQLPRFGGEAVEITAERCLIRFASSVEAVAWSVDLQERLQHASKAGRPAALHMRIAVHADDVIVDEGKVIGDAVNVVDRLRQICPPDQVLVSGAVHRLVRGRLPVSLRFEGEKRLQDCAESVEAYLVMPEVAATGPTLASPRLMSQQLPTVAVIPFDTGGSDEDRYFGEGVTEEIITALSLNRSLFVIARNSTLGFRGASAVGTAAAQLGVRYIVGGSIRRASSRLRINAELTDTRGNGVIWADHFEGADDDLFRFQAEIAARISAQIDPRVHEAEIARMRERPTESFGAYDCLLQGIALRFGVDQGDFDRAGTLFRRATELDPDYARAHAYLAWWHALRFGEGRAGAPLEEDRRSSERLFNRAVELDPRDAWILAMAAHHMSFLHKRFAAAMGTFNQALEINPNCATAWSRSATTLAYLGRGSESLERVGNAMRLSPFDLQGFSFCTTNGLACIVSGRYDEGIAWLGRALRLNPRYRAAARLLVAAHGLAGDRESAETRAREFLLDEPSFRVSTFVSWYPLQPPHLDRVAEALRLAGMPG